MSDFISALENRHSQYALNGEIAAADADVVKLIERVTFAVPSAFNSQSQRVVVLFGDEHKKLWNEIVKDALHKVAASEEAFAKTSAKIDTFAAGHGTVLYFDDTEATQKLAEQFPLYAQTFPAYAEQSLGMLELSVWTALSEAGIGASLQHYNPLIDDAVREAFGLPEGWKLNAQMPFGGIVEQMNGADHMAIDERMKVLGL